MLKVIFAEVRGYANSYATYRDAIGIDHKTFYEQIQTEK